MKISDKNNLKIGALLSYFAVGVNIIIGLLYTPWMIEQIGTSDYGIFSLATSIISIFAIDFGLGQAVTKFISKYKAMGEEEKIPSFLGAVYTLYLIISAIIFIILIVVYFNIEVIYIKLTPEEISRLKVVFIIAGLFSVMSFPFQPLNGILVSNQKFIALKTFDMATKVISVLMIVVCLILKQGLYSLVLVNAGVGLAIILIKVLYITFGLKVKPKFGKIEWKLIKSIFSFSIFVIIMQTAGIITRGLMPSILGITSGTEQITIYTTANTIIGYVYLIAMALDGMFLPKVTEFVVKDDYEGLNKFAKNIAKVQMLIVGAIITVFIGCGKEFIYNWVGDQIGEQYKFVYIGIVITLIPNYITYTISIGKTALIANNNVKICALSYIIDIIIAFPLSFGLSFIWGAMGVFVGIAVASLITGVFLNSYLYFKKARINIKNLYLSTHLRNLPAIALTLLVCYFVQKYLPVESLILVLIKCALIGLLYLFLSGICLLNKSDYALIKEKIIRKK